MDNYEALIERTKPYRFPVNRKDHTKKGPHLTTILKKLLSAEWDFHDKKIKALIKKQGLKETIEVALMLRRILNGTEGDDMAIERILDRIEGKVKSTEETKPDTRTLNIILVTPQERLNENRVAELSV